MTEPSEPPSTRPPAFLLAALSILCFGAVVPAPGAGPEGPVASIEFESSVAISADHVSRRQRLHFTARRLMRLPLGVPTASLVRARRRTTGRRLLSGFPLGGPLTRAPPLPV